MPPSRHLTIVCARCGGAAAEIALLPGTTEGESMWHDRDRLERTDFLGTIVKFGERERLEALFDTVARGDYAAARDLDDDFVAFHCQACQAAYCAECWRVDSPQFDDGFYDYTLGTCPAGHEQIVDD